jgi:aminodeoxychorismate lyase
MPPVMSVNGERVSAAQPALSPLDRGVTLGDGVFETMRVELGTVWYLERHLARLERATRHMGIPNPPRLRQWIADLLATPEIAAAPMAALRITLTRGIAHTHGLAADVDTPTTLITAAPLQPFPESIYTTGLTLAIASARLNEYAYTAGVKTTSYAEPILAVREARAGNYDDALFLNTQGFVAEASASNIFAWHDETLMTPSLDSGILPGITRDILLELCAGQHIATEERPIMLEELTQSSEVFCTSSLRGIAPVVAVGNTRIGAGVPGPRTRALMARYAAQSRRV